ncbi:MAG TPA: DUF4258 domain-containing protein, partial [Pirellulaceae bacterium]|nr:DUF4258 domain-containing protein [Pirellulaceae bacterium]
FSRARTMGWQPGSCYQVACGRRIGVIAGNGNASGKRLAGHKPNRYLRRPMSDLFDIIRRLMADEKYVVGEHASERLEERGIMEWQAVAGLETGELIIERPNATPNPAVEVRESLPDGAEFKAVWSHLR